VSAIFSQNISQSQLSDKTAINQQLSSVIGTFVSVSCYANISKHVIPEAYSSSMDSCPIRIQERKPVSVLRSGKNPRKKKGRIRRKLPNFWIRIQFMRIQMEIDSILVALQFKSAS